MISDAFQSIRLLLESGFSLHLSLMPISFMILLIILFLFKIGVFPQPSSLYKANGTESKHEFFCVLCQEYWQTIPDQRPGRQTKYQNKLPNLHWPWKFCLVQDCVSALASEKHTFSSYRMESVYLLSRQIGQSLISTSPDYWY